MNAIIYARVSPRRDVEDSDSIEHQVDICRKYCEVSRYEVLDVTSDKGLSGKTTNKREGLEAAIRLACKHKAVLVCYQWDRLARNLRDLQDILERLHGCGADLASVNERIDTSTPGGKLLFQIMGAVAEFMRKDAARKTSEHMLEMQSNGKRVSKRLPYGYEIIPDSEIPKGCKLPSKMRENAAEQLVILAIMSYHRCGLSARSIARYLNEDGKTCRGNKWHHQTVNRIISRNSEKNA